MANYELMLILDPSVSEEDRNLSLGNLKETLEQSSCKIEKENVWGVKKMAYKIKSSNEGFYVLFDLEIDGQAILDLTKGLNLDQNVWRHMFVRKDI